MEPGVLFCERILDILVADFYMSSAEGTRKGDKIRVKQIDDSQDLIVFMLAVFIQSELLGCQFLQQCSRLLLKFTIRNAMIADSATESLLELSCQKHSCTVLM